MTQTLTTKQLNAIAAGEFDACSVLDASVSMARELLANREAQPVAYLKKSIIDSQRFDSVDPEIILHPNTPEGWHSEYQAVFTAPPAPAVPDERAEFESFIAQKFGEAVDRRRAENGDNEYMAWDMAVAWIVWQRRAMLNHSGDANEKAQPVRQGYKFDSLNIRAVAALREAVRNQWLKSNEFADKVYWHNMHSIANEIIEAMAAAKQAKPIGRGEDMLVMPDGLHRDTKALLLVFASAMAVKLHKAEQKYGYSNMWMLGDWQDKCLNDFNHHITKGDPLDVANYCAFMHYHGWGTSK